MWVGSPVLMCSYTVARGGGGGQGMLPLKKWQNGAIRAYQSMLLPTQNSTILKIIKWNKSSM